MTPTHPPASAARSLFLRDQRDRIAAALLRFQARIPPSPPEVPAEVARAVADIHRHLFDPALDVTAVRQRCGLRNNNVSTRFRTALGEGIREYIERLRLEAASELLAAGNLEIFLVALAVGYHHQETFSRAFQRHFGCAPSELAGRLKKKRQEAGEGEIPGGRHSIV
jgi:transcriptional regulator GlxA family with amidase domain